MQSEFIGCLVCFLSFKFACTWVTSSLLKNTIIRLITANLIYLSGDGFCTYHLIYSQSHGSKHGMYVAPSSHDPLFVTYLPRPMVWVWDHRAPVGRTRMWVPYTSQAQWALSLAGQHCFSIFWARKFYAYRMLVESEHSSIFVSNAGGYPYVVLAW